MMVELPQTEQLKPMETSMTGRLVAVCTLMAAVLANTSLAQDYPSRPVRIVVGTPAGGVSDLTARAVAEHMRQKFNQPFLVENRPGASGKIGAEFVARSAADGYTLLFANPSTFSLPTLTDKIPNYDPIGDFAPIGYVGISAYFLVAPAISPYKSLRDFLTSEKAAKGEINFGNASFGSASHFAAAMLALTSAFNVTHVPYRGEAPMITGLISGQIDVAFATGARPFIESGQLRALGVSSRERFAPMPDVPLISEQGVSGFSFLGWLGLLAPARTPPDVISALNSGMQSAAVDERVKKLMLDNGIAPATPAPPERLAALIGQDILKLRSLIAEGRIKVDQQ
jgi:tripartite-type tricarboxylate transporter receptor subunit TctC